MTKLYYQLKQSLNLEHYVISFKQLPFDTFRDVLSFRNNNLTYDISNSVRAALDMMIFETREKAEKWLRPRIREMIHEIRKGNDKNYVKSKISDEKVTNFMNHSYRIMTLNKLWNDPKRWDEECAESDLVREKFKKELEAKGK